jgi:hypothetical protein
MYAKVETDISFGHLLSIVEGLRADCCLIGGWAVFYIVNERYRRAQMRDYIGSRDIDIGVPDSDALKALDELLLRMRFEHLSFRYVKYLNYDTGEELDSEKAKALPLHMLIELYVDAMIPFRTEDAREAVGFTPPDEPILAQVFADAAYRTMVRIAGHDVRVPTPEMLLAMKLNSLGNRTKDHKRIKDVCDIAALCLFAGKDLEKLIARGLAVANPKKAKTIRSEIREDDYAQASGFLGIPKDAIRAIIERISVA